MSNVMTARVGFAPGQRKYGRSSEFLHFLLRVLVFQTLLGLGLFMTGQSSQASTIEAVNHTHWAINRFWVDGQGAADIVGPYQGGGGGCCFIAPKRWVPGMTVLVEWQTGVGYSFDTPSFADWPKYLEWVDRIEAQKRNFSREIAVPDYTNQKVCGITVHFLPCDELQVTTSCHAFGTPEYPIQIPLRLAEPKSCPM